MVFGEGPAGFPERGLCLAEHEGRVGGPIGPELVLKSAGTWVREALSSCFSFSNVAAFLAQDLFHEGNGAPSSLFRAFRLVNVKFFAHFQRTPWSCFLGKAQVIFLDCECLLRIWSKDELV